MKYNSFSIVAGSMACNARCPFCISKMTPAHELTNAEVPVNWRNFEIAARLARDSGVDTAKITGKGEPTLFPEQVAQFVRRSHEQGFPLIELQTNGITLATDAYQKHLQNWYDNGLTTLAISIVHYDPQKNKQVYTPARDYYDLPAVIKKAHDIGLTVRLSCIMMKEFIDNAGELEKLIAFANENQAEQLTVMPVARPASTEDADVYSWTARHQLTEEQVAEQQQYLERNGKKILEFTYGGAIYDVFGQNVCLATCLDCGTNPNNVRQLIFFPNGRIKFNWQYEAAIIL